MQDMTAGNDAGKAPEDAMIRRLSPPLLFTAALALFAQTAYGDWGHHGGHGSGAPVDPAFEAFAETVLVIAAASAALLVLGGPIWILRARRIRDILWGVPLANLVLVLLSILIRPHPGGFPARFRPPGLKYTAIEILLLTAGSILLAVLIAAGWWVTRRLRSFRLRGLGAREGPKKSDSGPSQASS
jgi:hypothetical protein